MPEGEGGTITTPNYWRQYVVALEVWIVQHYGKRVRDEACNEAVMAVLTQRAEAKHG